MTLTLLLLLLLMPRGQGWRSTTTTSSLVQHHSGPILMFFLDLTLCTFSSTSSAFSYLLEDHANDIHSSHEKGWTYLTCLLA